MDAYHDDEDNDDDLEVMDDQTHEDGEVDDDHVIEDGKTEAQESWPENTTCESKTEVPDDILDSDDLAADNFEDINDIEQLRAQLNDYKVLAQSLEKRIADLHKECTRKDDVIARLRKKRIQSIQPTSTDTVQVGIAELEAQRAERKLNVPEYPAHIKKLGQEKLVAWRNLKKNKTDEKLKEIHHKAAVAYREAVSQFRDTKETATKDNEVLRKMFVGGLSSATTNESLRDYFSQFGEIMSCSVMMDNATKRSRGYGFIIYSTTAAVDEAQAARPHELDNKIIDTKRCLPKGEHAKNAPGANSVRIFIGGVKQTTDEVMLRDYFSQFGDVQHVDLPQDKSTGKRRGFGYVTFSDSDPVDKVSIMKYHTIDDKRCEVKKAVTRDELESLKKPGELKTDSKQPAPNFPAPNFRMAQPGFMPRHRGPFSPPTSGHAGFWRPPVGAPGYPQSALPPLHTPPYGYMEPLRALPAPSPFAPHAPAHLGSGSLLPPPLGGRGVPPARWPPQMSGPGPIHTRLNSAQRNVGGPYRGPYGIRPAR